MSFELDFGKISFRDNKEMIQKVILLNKALISEFLSKYEKNEPVSCRHEKSLKIKPSFVVNQKRMIM